jgi:hypothetical protein
VETRSSIFFSGVHSTLTPRHQRRRSPIIEFLVIQKLVKINWGFHSVVLSIRCARFSEEDLISTLQTAFDIIGKVGGDIRQVVRCQKIVQRLLDAAVHVSRWSWPGMGQQMASGRRLQTPLYQQQQGISRASKAPSAEASPLDSMSYEDSAPHIWNGRIISRGTRPLVG